MAKWKDAYGELDVLVHAVAFAKREDEDVELAVGVLPLGHHVADLLVGLDVAGLDEGRPDGFGKG